MQNDTLLYMFASDLRDILQELEKMDFGHAKFKLKARIKEIENGNYKIFTPKADE